MPEQNEIRPGQMAPDFTLEDEHERPVQLSKLRGVPVVLMFYPFDWSGLCTQEVCAMRDMGPEWQRVGARVLGISRDSTYSHKAWKEHLGINYSLLADLSGEVASLYGCWNEALHRADRMTVVVDPEGVVRYVIHNHAGLVRDHHEALAAVREMAGSRA